MKEGRREKTKNRRVIRCNKEEEEERRINGMRSGKKNSKVQKAIETKSKEWKKEKENKKETGNTTKEESDERKREINKKDLKGRRRR